ncbi:DUF2510 domain-containing protein [Diaminobutyricibacter tongyongensis]|uniref:DUF2510 domain-containing protein n=1 Tax=Leifsonia tongyongensis TaxID=1268043 RepID=A0A6L9XX54_9MICO|nr:DUF2510 domain-containing protein [Diaminobutyricibacter tongyongensis]NEN06010.1 DUF2510 domain-containing protein [Diaminobutyricibacter tongyongensis]
MTDARAPEAGWYPDPTGGLGQRWWTGLSWSDHTRQPSPGIAEIISSGDEGAGLEAGRANRGDEGDEDDEDDEDDDYLPLRGRRPGADVVGRRHLRNVLAYRSLNLGATSAMLFVVTVVLADLAWRMPPFGAVGWVAVAFSLIGTGVAVAAILFAAVSFFRVPTYRGLGPGLTGLAFGLVFTFSIPLAGLALQLVLATFG